MGKLFGLLKRHQCGFEDELAGTIEKVVQF